MKIKFLITSISSLFYILLSLQIHAQGLGNTKKEIIAGEGENYLNQTSENGIPFLLYSTNETTNASGDYLRGTSYYFKDGIFCTAISIIEPKTESNNWAKFLNDKYVEKEDNYWKDYEKNILYHLIINEKHCIISIYYDAK